MHAFAEIRMVDEDVHHPPEIEPTETTIMVDGHLVDLTAMHHWRQTEDHDGSDHSPDQDYLDIRRWHLKVTSKQLSNAALRPVKERVR